MKSALTLLTALLLAGAPASAQELSTSLPLTSVGNRLLWSVGDQQLTLDVPIAGRVRLELYSAEFDPQDYRSDTYFGDERYDAGPVETTFAVIDAAGNVVTRATFPAGAHSWRTLIDQDLPAGTYHLEAVTAGNGKNTFALRLTGVQAAVRANRVAVNVHARDWVPVVNVTTDGAGDVLRLYDGDGPTELEARLRGPDGRTTPIPVSAQLGWVEIPLPSTPGAYSVELRQPTTARQYSNTVAFTLTRAGSAADLTLTRVDTTGTLRVDAELLLPGGAVPTVADVRVGDATLHVDGSATQAVNAGTYPVRVAPVAGATVAASAATVTVPRGGTGQVRVQVKPDVTLNVTADRQEVCVGDVVTFTATARTAYAGDLPVNLRLALPDGVTPTAESAAPTTVSAATPAVTRVEVRAQRPGPLSANATLDPWAKQAAANVTVRADATTVQLRRAPLSAAAPGSEVTVTLSATNTGSAPVPFALADAPAPGLTPLEPTSFTGTLAPGETRAFTYRARVSATTDVPLSATLRAEGCGAPQAVAGTLPVQAPPAPVAATPTPTPAARPAPDATRTSEIRLPFDAPAEATTLILAHTFPTGATYVPGSSRLNGAALPDPIIGTSGRAYWTVPGQRRGTLTYDVTHTGALPALQQPALRALYPRERAETLQGTFDAGDYAGATARPATPAATENAGALKLPLSGTVYRDRDRVTVVVEGPIGATLTPTINGEPIPEARLGGRVNDPARGTQRLTYVAVPLRVGENALALGRDTVTVTYAGPTARVDITPVSVVADGSTPLRLRVRALDERGVGTAQPFLTLRPSLEPRTPDANPGEAGYQVRLVDGEGELVLAPQASPTTLTIDTLIAGRVERRTFDVRPDDGRVGVGVVSVTLGFPGDGVDVRTQARAYLETPLAGGKLYVAADKDGLPTDSDPNTRAPVFGDASTEQVPLQGLDPFAFDFDHPAFRVQYRQTTVPIEVLPLGERLTALTARSKTNPSVSGFVALVPEDRVRDRLTPNGTRLARLTRFPVAPGSETVEVVTLERGTGKELARRTLVRLVDYTLDTETGVLTLTRALDRIDADLNDVELQVSYRLLNAGSNRDLAFGVQLQQVGAGYTLGIAAVSLDGQLTTGVRGTVNTGPLNADVRVAYAGGVQASADLDYRTDAFTASARARYQSATYAGLNPFTPGLALNAAARLRVTPNVALIADAEHRDQPGLYSGNVSARAEVRLKPFSVGAGLKYAYGTQSGLGAIVSAGYHRNPLDVDVVHTQPITGTLDPTTDFTARVALTDSVALAVRDTVNWRTGHTATVSLDSRLGNTNFSVAYDLPTASGAGNRARFGVTTELPLNNQFSVGVRAALIRDLNAGAFEASGGADLRYKSDTLSATLGTDLAWRAGALTTVVRGGVTGSLTRNLTLTADGTAEFGARVGARFALGAAYRNGPLNALAYARYQTGSLSAGQPELLAGAAAEYHQPRYAVRGGLDLRARPNDPNSFTYQPTLGATYYVTDDLGVGAWGRALLQPGLQSAQYGFGVEGTARVLPGTWFTVGYNLLGFDGLGNTYTRPGAYLRLDLTLDESVGK
ncbi:DUF11 domain-containing protein [Deinococcus maricopensis]|uniref:Conserved repeat domain protein n=1 Tax=Deinococcus maricopensis (strain DSM 21211 / LMG 22137 / NRRL B-23946 / LB-34) TaxID=709986 RepID=E8UBZ4_DEIML|nr:DUF11 domain-containing protein [Deinococcus maricopensis]ADV68583.1 conserved repeat domain protein [Deinococcus maricopensis DSM 21211]